ncbi:MAG: hypothetical protein U9Q67_02360 [Patescibacteria group bacterium]|nr:hypothetical protein [Patescibacteria group bacterium]
MLNSKYQIDVLGFHKVGEGGEVKPNKKILEELFKRGKPGKYCTSYGIRCRITSFNDAEHHGKQKLAIYNLLPCGKRSGVHVYVPIVLGVRGGRIGRSAFVDNGEMATLYASIQEEVIIVTFDPRGFDSNENKVSYSLETRSADILAVLQVIGKPEFWIKIARDYSKAGIFWNGKVILLGASMGGYDVAYLSSLVVPDALIMCVPAAYSKAAHTVRFGESFTRAIRKSESWKDSYAYDNFARYRNPSEGSGVSENVLIIQKQSDDIVDASIVNQYVKVRPVGTRCIKTPGGHGTVVLKDVLALTEFIKQFSGSCDS